MDAAPDVGCHLNVILPGLDDPRLGGVLAALAEAGYRRVVLPPLDPGSVDAAALRATFAAHALTPIPIAGQTPSADVSSPDAEVRAAGVAALRAQLDLAEALGGDQLNGVPYGLFGRAAGAPGQGALERSAELVGWVAGEAHERGIVMTFEVLNRYETPLINTAAQAMEYVALSGSEHLRIHLDTFHMAVEESDLLGAITLALPKLGYLELGQSGRGALDRGAVDVGAVVAHARALGYAGRFGVEAFSRPVLGPAGGDALAIWRDTYADGLAVAREAMETVVKGFLRSPQPL
jgi:D-psicose/D-tagatose/L-ribulose 3-epimerase